jgi:delta8-fatty-acid desaturase
MDVDCPEWMDWFHGGLQYQTTHHLFPRLPRHRLRFVREMAMEYAKEQGIKYNHFPFVEANGVVLGKLRDVAGQARIYFEVAKGLEGMEHAHGDVKIE